MGLDSRASWDRFLNPEELRTNLVLGSIYIAAFEMLKDTVLERLRSFYTYGFSEDGPLISPDYSATVESRDRSPVYASLLWLEEAGAIDSADILAFTAAKDYRNALAHRMTDFVTTGFAEDYGVRFSGMVELLRKIEIWWVRSVDMTVDPSLSHLDVSDEDILPGPLLALDLMLKIALGTKKEARGPGHTFG